MVVVLEALYANKANTLIGHNISPCAVENLIISHHYKTKMPFTEFRLQTRPRENPLDVVSRSMEV